MTLRAGHALELRLDDIKSSWSLISMWEFDAEAGYSHSVTVDENYRHLGLDLIDCLADGVAAERRHQRFACGAATNLSPQCN